jgi:hypothetical protein
MEARFSVPVQTDPGAYPASCTMGTGSFPGAKRLGRNADHPHPPSAEVGNEYKGYRVFQGVKRPGRGADHPHPPSAEVGNE